MNALPSPDRFHLSAALGWIELGNAAEANQELDRIAASLQSHPHVLALRWQIHAKSGDWNRAFEIAGALVQLEPDDVSRRICLAYATRRMRGGGLPRAWDILRPAADRFPAEPTVAFNLACYACQMGRLEEAREWLAKAIALGGEPIAKMAQEDEDLKPLRL